MLVWLDVVAMGSISLISRGNGATVSICDLSKKKISFQNKFSGWEDVFQMPHQHKYVDVACYPIEHFSILMKRQMTIPSKIMDFLSTAKDISLGYNEINFFQPKNLAKEQTGYSVDSKGKSLVTGKDGDWQENWVVIASDQSGDPILVDTTSTDLTVLSASHGEEEWEPFVIADSLECFKNIIAILRDISKNRISPVQLEKNPIPDKEKQNILTKIENQNPSTELLYWESFFEND